MSSYVCVFIQTNCATLAFSLSVYSVGTNLQIFCAAAARKQQSRTPLVLVIVIVVVGPSQALRQFMIFNLILLIFALFVHWHMKFIRTNTNIQSKKNYACKTDFLHIIFREWNEWNNRAPIGNLFNIETLEIHTTHNGKYTKIKLSRLSHVNLTFISVGHKNLQVALEKL